MPLKSDAKSALVSALRNLLKCKPFENISVENILEKSGVSRATFYRHFPDKYWLMFWVYKAQVDEIVQRNALPSQSVNILVESARFMKENEDYFSQIVKFKGQNSFMDFINVYVRDISAARICKVLGIAELPYELMFAVKYHCGGVTNLISEWLSTGLKEPPEQLGKMLYDCIPPSIRGLME